MKPIWPRGSAGVCLAEAMIAMAAGLVVLSASIQALKHFDHRFLNQQKSMAGAQELRVGLKVLQDELHLAGAGDSAAAIIQADPTDLVFLANVSGLSTVLSQSIPAGHLQLPVEDGSGWPKNKRVVICSAEVCAEGRLSRDGQAKVLNLVNPLGQAFPAGSTVSVSNQVRYYLGKDARGKATLMRQMDGGANPLIGDIAQVRFCYLDQSGRLTQDARRIARVRVELAVGDGRRVITSEIGLRAL